MSGNFFESRMISIYKVAAGEHARVEKAVDMPQSNGVELDSANE